VTKNVHICSMCSRSFVAFFSATVDGRNLIFGHKRHIGIPYCGKRFWTRQIPTSCLLILLIFIHQTDRGKTVYPPPPSESGGIKMNDNINMDSKIAGSVIMG
jgi:hypothetical protein